MKISKFEEATSPRTRTVRKEEPTMKFGIFIRYWIVNCGLVY